MTELPIIVCQVDTPEGVKNFVTCLSSNQVFERGLPAQAIIGEVLGPQKSGSPIRPDAFARNRVFVDFMHEVIAKRGPRLRGLLEAARQQGQGWVYIIDQRTRTPEGAVPPEDIVGAFQVTDGNIVVGSYQPNAGHRILSDAGFFRLGELQPCLMEELAALA